MSTRSEFREGVSKITPLIAPAGTVGLATGVAAPVAGLSPL